MGKSRKQRTIDRYNSLRRQAVRHWTDYVGSQSPDDLRLARMSSRRIQALIRNRGVPKASK